MPFANRTTAPLPRTYNIYHLLLGCQLFLNGISVIRLLLQSPKIGPLRCQMRNLTEAPFRGHSTEVSGKTSRNLGKKLGPSSYVCRASTAEGKGTI